MRFSDRTVIVTGSAQGIGRGIVRAFLDEGASVFAADINAAGLEGTAALAPDRVKTHTVDLADVEQARGVVPAALEVFDRVHVLVNCAGVMPDGPLLDITRETFDRTFAVNARAPMLIMQSIAPHLAEHGGGAIVNITSANAFKNESPEAAYNASKAALVALTNAAAHEWGHLGIRVNSVAPGQTVTPEGAAEIEADPEEAHLQREYLWKIPLRRAGSPRDQAMAVLFLASDDAAWITGQTIIVDGGELGGGDWYDRSAAPPLPPDPNGA
jgi:NAD(P)-dependent dehydrogenase (short-subunit alcohol dehydrogenase family)